MPTSNEYENDFSGFGRNLVNATNSIEEKKISNERRRSNERRGKASLIKKYGPGSLEKRIEENQILYNNLKNQASAVPHKAANFGPSGFKNSRKVFGTPKKNSRPVYGTPVDLGGGRKRKTHKKQRLSRKVKKTYRKRR